MPTKTIDSKRNKIEMMERVVFVLFCILIAYPPFFRGLFFEKELVPTHMFSFSLALVWMILKFKDKEYRLIRSWLDITAMGLVFMYFISTFYAVSTRLAILELLKYANYFVVYLLARDLSGTDVKKRWILNTLVISAVAVSVVGIGAYIGTWNKSAAVLSGRIASTFQYPNALASYLGAVFIITLGLISIEKNKVFKIMYGMASNVLLFTFILTYSRGMWLMLPVMLLAFILSLPNERKLELIILLILNVFIAVSFSMKFEQMSSYSGAMQWLIFMLALLLIAGFMFLISLVDGKIKRVNIDTKKLVIITSIIVVLLGGGILYAFSQTTSLTLENTTNKDKWTSIYRDIDAIEENQEYVLSAKLGDVNKNEKSYAGRVRIYSIDSQHKLEHIKTDDISNVSDKEIQVKFRNYEGSDRIRVYFLNYYSGTSITFDEVNIISEKDDKVVENIKLKYKYIPETLIRRIGSINLKDDSAQSRLNFYKDSFKVIKDYTLFGTGGGGWKKLYTMFQSYGYTSTQAHNYFLKLWIEIGLIGLFIFLVQICLLTYFLIKVLKNVQSEKRKTLMISIFFAFVSILAHSFMDFDLSLSALTIVLWTFMGVLSNIIFNDKSKEYKDNTSNLLRIFSIVVIVLLLLNSTSFYIGNIFTKKAVEASQAGDIDEAINEFEKVAIFDPFKVEIKADLSNLYKVKYMQTKHRKNIMKSIKYMEEAQKLGEYDVSIKALGASFYLSIGQVYKGLSLIDKTVEIQPMRTENYVQKSSAYLNAFKYYMNQEQDKGKAKQIIENAYTIKDDINTINAKAVKPLEYNEKLLYNLGHIQFYKENFYNKGYKIEDNYALDFAFYFDLDIDNNGKLDTLHKWNSENGNIGYKHKKDQGNYIRISNDGKSNGMIYLYGLKLNPDTNYKVLIKAKGTVNNDTFSFSIHDNKTENQNQGELTNIKLGKDWNTYELKVKTDSDIEPGTQFLKLQHNGSDKGYIDLEKVIIYKQISEM